MSPTLKAWLVDAGERCGRTFAQAFLAVYGTQGILDLAGGHLNMTLAHQALQAGVAAVLAIITSALAAPARGTVSPASFAPAQQPGQAEQAAPPAPGRRVVVMSRSDPRLGRHVEHDERSRSYPADKASSLKTVRHRHYGRVLDQGQLGSCTGNALVDALMTAPLHKPGRVLTEGDAIKVYELATTLDGVPGTYPPDDTGSSGLAACKAAQRLGLISSYRHAFGLDEALAALVLSPVMVGIPWYESMFTPDAAGMLSVSGKVAGGHEVALIGIDVTRRTVTVQNSWGPSWGVHGHAYLSWDDLGRLLNESGDVTVPIA